MAPYSATGSLAPSIPPRHVDSPTLPGSTRLEGVTPWLGLGAEDKLLPCAGAAWP